MSRLSRYLICGLCSLPKQLKHLFNIIFEGEGEREREGSTREIEPARKWCKYMSNISMQIMERVLEKRQKAFLEVKDLVLN